jgi:lipopolysaccharide transport system ATP-binding protein
MSGCAIRVEGVSKHYMIGRRRDVTDLRECLTEAVRTRFSATLAWNSSFAITGKEQYRGIWALRDVSFEVKCGEIVGIIGDNGSGKTTALKILSRITQPTAGYGEIRGRVGTLLDLGAGLHGELTGRENIYLNGALKGMTLDQVKSRFDEIVAFAELERFIDTPLKHYSTGMCVRLAFAVAAHLESEILLVDDLLAQADSVFQRKCVEKLASAGREGRTILLVSHDSDYILQLCSRVMVFAEGRFICDGPAPEMVDRYRTISVQQAEPFEAAPQLTVT